MFAGAIMAGIDKTDLDPTPEASRILSLEVDEEPSVLLNKIQLERRLERNVLILGPS